jgi:uncharacterized spore protein YtfJ
MIPTDLLSTLAAQVRAIAKSETVVGDPITMGDATIIPVTRVTLGFGGGSGSGEVDEREKAEKAGGSGGGGGGGVRIEPAAFILMQAGQVTVLAAPGKRGALAEMFEQVPDLIEKIVSKQQEKQGKEKPADD